MEREGAERAGVERALASRTICVQLDILTVELEGALHDHHVDVDVAVKQDPLAVLNPDGVTLGLEAWDRVLHAADELTAPRRVPRP